MHEIYEKLRKNFENCVKIGQKSMNIIESWVITQQKCRKSNKKYENWIKNLQKRLKMLKIDGKLRNNVKK